MKKVSVIIPIHNSSKFLNECIDSVINQTYKNLEIIIIDDHSTDNSIKLLESINDSRIKIYKLKNKKGAANARNLGIEKATGDYICFLDSDDYWYKDKVEKQVSFIEKNNYTFIYGTYLYLKNGKKHIAKIPKSMTYNKALKNTAIFTSSVMFNMKKLTKDDIYMPDVSKGQDTLTWWKVLKKGITAYNINEVLVVYRVGEKSLSHNKINALKRTWNIYKEEKINIFKRIYYFTCYVINAIKRRI